VAVAAAGTGAWPVKVAAPAAAATIAEELVALELRGRGLMVEVVTALHNRFTQAVAAEPHRKAMLEPPLVAVTGSLRLFAVLLKFLAAAGLVVQIRPV
jgi:hypothetical protein